ncbi:MAG TPA: hypothetical protein VGA56_10125 [Opitutaceae bacterium]
MKTILLSYAGRDANYRSLLVAATRAAGLAVRFVELPGVVTDPVDRRHLCAAELQHCDAAIVLMSPHARMDAGVGADIEAVRDHQVPLLAIKVGEYGARRMTHCDWPVSSTLDWNWSRISAFLQRMGQSEKAMTIP